MDAIALKQLFHQWLTAYAPSEGRRWLEQKTAEYQADPKDRSFYLTFGAAPRYLGKAKVQPAAGDHPEIAAAHPWLFRPEWTIDQIARTWLLLHLPTEPAEAYVERFEKLFLTADMGEQVALYQFLAFAAHPERFRKRAAEGVRTNITAVFDAIALDNPYPAAQLDEGAWNQLVLKAAFMDRPIWRIYGLSERANERLATIISDYAHERWSAGRVVSPEFWRPVGPFLNDTLLADIRKLFQSDSVLQHKAAALVCADSAHEGARALLQEHPALAAATEQGDLTWDSLGREWWAQK